jgi:hypothetical protein
MRILLISLVMIYCTTFAQAKSHKHSKTVDSPLLSPTHQCLVLQNLAIDQQHLERIQDEKELRSLVEAGRLEALPITDAMKIAPSLPANRRYVLPQVNVFLGQLSGEFFAQFSVPLVIDSAVRPVTTQKKLRRINRSAAPAEGETASSHEAGTTVDIARRGLTKAQTRWLEMRLVYYYAIGRVLVEEERSCFHIMTLGEEQ